MYINIYIRALKIIGLSLIKEVDDNFHFSLRLVFVSLNFDLGAGEINYDLIYFTIACSN